MIELWNVNKTYETGNKALRNINITVEDGEFVSSSAGAALENLRF